MTIVSAKLHNLTSGERSDTNIAQLLDYWFPKMLYLQKKTIINNFPTNKGEWFKGLKLVASFFERVE